MELNDIMALVKAGYTKDEITQMESPNPAEQTPVQTPAPTPVQEQTPVQMQIPIPAPVDVPVAQPVPAPAPQPTQAQTEPTMAELMQSIAKLTSAVQANAIAQSVIPGGANPQTPTAEDMLAEIIRPTFKAREG